MMYRFPAYYAEWLAEMGANGKARAEVIQEMQDLLDRDLQEYGEPGDAIHTTQ